MTPTCARCGDPLPADGRERRWCSDRCRVAAKRAAEAGESVSLVDVTPADAEAAPGAMEVAVLARLNAYNEGSVEAAAALDLARRLDRSDRPTSSAAALHREMRNALDKLGDAPGVPDRIDEMQAKRRARMDSNGEAAS